MDTWESSVSISSAADLQIGHSAMRKETLGDERYSAKALQGATIKEVPMLTLEELEHSKINPTIAKEAYLQAEKRLSDVLDTKKSLEHRASTLFSSYVTIALALFGIGGVIFEDAGLHSKTWPFFIAGTVFVLGACFFMLVIKDDKYGFLGSAPDMWLNRGTIDGVDKSLAAMFAYLTYHHAKRIDISGRSNDRKICALRAGMLAGVAATVIFAICFFAFT